VKKFTKITSMAIAAMSTSLPAFAATVDGNLNVETNVNVTCSAPEASGNLVLPFDSAMVIAGQNWATSPVTVTVSCTGTPTINYVSFDEGQNRSATNLGGSDDGIRYMQLDGSDGSLGSHFLGYQLMAAAGDVTASEIRNSGIEVGTGATTGDNQLTIGDSAATFSVVGRVRELTERTGAFGDPSSNGSGTNVSSGNYKDVVVMTIDYN
jgi:spore coat protein U-like protein